MKKNYLYIITLVLCFFTLTLSAQEGKQQPKSQDAIEGLSLYPNPVSNGKIYISSKATKNVFSYFLRLFYVNFLFQRKILPIFVE